AEVGGHGAAAVAAVPVGAEELAADGQVAGPDSDVDAAQGVAGQVVEGAVGGHGDPLAVGVVEGLGGGRAAAADDLLQVADVDRGRGRPVLDSLLGHAVALVVVEEGV